MPFNGSGTFNRLYSWTVDAANNVDIRADKMDNEMNGMATALSDCITRDGQSVWLNNIPAGGFIITGLGPGSGPQHSVTFGQVFTNPVFTAPSAAADPPTGDMSQLLSTTSWVSQLAFSTVLPGQAGNAGKGLQTDGTAATWQTITVGKTLLDGLTASYASSTTIGVSTGFANDDTGTIQAPNIALTAATTKSVFTAFAVGTGNGASDGTVATTGWNYLWVIGGASVATDILASASATAPTLPAGFTAKRRIAAFYASSSAVLQFVQRGGMFYFTAQLTETLALSASASGSLSGTVGVTHVPPNMIGLLSVQSQSLAGSVQAGVTAYNADETVPTMTATSGFDWLYSNASGLVSLASGYIERRITSGGALKWGMWVFAGTTPYTINLESNIHGWKDERGIGQS